MTSEEFATQLFQKHNVAVVPGSVFGLGGEGHIRVCYATAVEKIKSRAQDACSVLFQLIIVIREKKSKCLFKGMPECAYLQGVINGYVLKLFAAIGGASYK